MADQAVLKIGGRRYDGWKRVTINRSLETGAGDFDLEVTDRWSGQDKPWPIAAGDACELLIDEDVMIRGWVDDASPSFDAGSHGFSVRGRDRAGDLVDCSAVHRPGSWRGRRLEQIAAELVKPFGLAVVTQTDTGAAFRKFALQQGDTVWDTLERMGRLRGVLIGSTETGDIRIWRPTRARASYVLEQGVNLLSGRVEHSTRERHSVYLLKGQAAGDDFTSGATVAQGKGQAVDAGISRYRPLLIIAEDQGAGGSLQDRARWEATVRAGRSQQVTVSVQGWRDAGGGIYRLDQLARVRAPVLGVDEDLLVCGLRFERGDRGTITEMTLMRPEAFSIEPVPAEAKASQLAGGRRRAA